MTTSGSAYGTGQQSGLIVQQEGKPQQVLAKFLNLMLNYQCGLTITVIQELDQAAEILLQEGTAARCVFVVQNNPLSNEHTLDSLGHNGALPLFLVLPQSAIERQRGIVGDRLSIYYCPWETAFASAESSLQTIVSDVLEDHGIGNLIQDIDKVPYAVLQQRVERRLKNLNTLPTLPEIIVRIMCLVSDPKTTTEQLEQLLCRDPAIVMKLQQVVKSPVFAGIGRKSSWSLTTIIVRLGLKKVGAIAQQIKLVNSLVKPQESAFDMRRFWEHSVGCAVIADKLVTGKMIVLETELEFNDYWISALLHDVGKLVLGFFYWDWFARVVEQMEKGGLDFCTVENKLGDMVNHERVGQLLMINANMGEDIAHAVGSHHTVGDDPSPLSCLTHMADNLCKEIGLGYLPEEPSRYDPRVMKKLKLVDGNIPVLREALAEDILEEVKNMVDQCL